MELEDIFQYVGLAATAALAVYGWRRLPAAGGVRGWFLAALLGLTGYHNLALLLHPAEFLSPIGLLDAWFRHLVFYAGQLFFFIFIYRVIFRRPEERKKRVSGEAGAVLAFLLLAGLQLAFPHGAHAHHDVDLLTDAITPYRVIAYLSDQGVQHIIAIVFFLISLAVLRSQSLYAELHPETRGGAKVIAPFLIGNAAFTALHVWEFLAESRHLFASLPDSVIESVEYGFVAAGLIMLFIGIRRLHENHL